MTTVDESTIEAIDVEDKSPEDAALTILIELRDVGFGRHTATVLGRHFDDIFESTQDAEEALERLRSRGLVAKSHAKGEFYYRPTEQGLAAQQAEERP